MNAANNFQLLSRNKKSSSIPQFSATTDTVFTNFGNLGNTITKQSLGPNQKLATFNLAGLLSIPRISKDQELLLAAQTRPRITPRDVVFASNEQIKAIESSDLTAGSISYELRSWGAGGTHPQPLDTKLGVGLATASSAPWITCPKFPPETAAAVSLTTGGLGYVNAAEVTTVRALPTGASRSLGVLVQATFNAAGTVTLINNINGLFQLPNGGRNNTVGDILTLESNGVSTLGLLGPGSGYPAVLTNVYTSALSGTGQGLTLDLTVVAGVITGIAGVNQMGSGYTALDVVQIGGLGPQGTTSAVPLTYATATITAVFTAGTAATVTVESLQDAKAGPYWTFTDPKLPVTSRANICLRENPVPRIYAATGNLAYNSLMSQGLEPFTNTILTNADFNLL